mmetsp:Transcript_97525/g.278869  ORF Transcript_97525/g.278869 Transcript_97525/m.278869 type:complete len:205 (-) Transcript_97525:279-893(-)
MSEKTLLIPGRGAGTGWTVSMVCEALSRFSPLMCFSLPYSCTTFTYGYMAGILIPPAAVVSPEAPTSPPTYLSSWSVNFSPVRSRARRISKKPRNPVFLPSVISRTSTTSSPFRAIWRCIFRSSSFFSTACLNTHAIRGSGLAERPCRCASGSAFMPPHRAFTSFAGADPGRERAAGADEGRADLFLRTGDEGRLFVGLLLLGF